jgi:hypothetical protein
MSSAARLQRASTQVDRTLPRQKIVNTTSAGLPPIREWAEDAADRHDSGWCRHKSGHQSPNKRNLELRCNRLHRI